MSSGKFSVRIRTVNVTTTDREFIFYYLEVAADIIGGYGGQTLRPGTILTLLMITGPVTRLFWDAKADALDLQQHRVAIIARVLNYGNLQDWRWLIEQYGEDAIRAEALSPGRNSVHPRTRRLAALLFA